MHETIARTNQQDQLQDTPINIKLRLSALWIVTMFIYAYVDIFGLFRADSLEALLNGEIANTPIKVGQAFLAAAVVYILPGSLMVYLSLTLRPKANQRANIIVATLYAITVVLSCVGESWIYYLLGSAIEVVLFMKIVHLASHWPKTSPKAEVIDSDRERMPQLA